MNAWLPVVRESPSAGTVSANAARVARIVIVMAATTARRIARACICRTSPHAQEGGDAPNGPGSMWDRRWADRVECCRVAPPRSTGLTHQCGQQRPKWIEGRPPEGRPSMRARKRGYLLGAHLDVAPVEWDLAGW